MADIARLYDFTAATTIASTEVDNELNQIIDELNAKEARLDTLEVNLNEDDTPVINVLYTATGATDISTTSTSYVDMTDMTITQTFLARDVLIIYNGMVGNSTASHNVRARIVVDGTPGNIALTQNTAGTPNHPLTIVQKATLTAASHTIKVQWVVDTLGTALQNGLTYATRTLTVLQM